MHSYIQIYKWKCLNLIIVDYVHVDKLGKRNEIDSNWLKYRIYLKIKYDGLNGLRKFFTLSLADIARLTIISNSGLEIGF